MCTYAQIPEDPVAVLSPNAASLGRYGDIPVSLYTGTPEISIPLYDIVVQDFVLPISLSYHAAGVQVDQRAGWTGVNWTLFAGGMITRKINDKPDDYNNPRRYLEVPQEGRYYRSNRGFYFNYNILNNSNWNQPDFLLSVAHSYALAYKDNSPDEFSFSFPGYNGKFYLDHNGGWAVQCDRPVKVEFDGQFTLLDTIFNKLGTGAEVDDYSPCFSGFTITTEDGTIYQFGKDPNAIDFSIDFFDQYNDEWVATAWHLTKITLPNTQNINFKYERIKDRYINQMYIAAYLNLETSMSAKKDLLRPAACELWSINTNVSDHIAGKLISPAYLKEISTDLVTVSFSKSLSNELDYNRITAYDTKYTNAKYQWRLFPILKAGMYNADEYYYPDCLSKLTWYKLDKITIQNKNKTKLLKTIDFSYNNSPNDRLFLESIKEFEKNPYTFSYYQRESLPSYLANKSDHWGYFNNTHNNLAYYYNYYQYKEPNPNTIKYGMLTKVNYPTGGYTEFEYEPHYYRTQLDIERWNPCVFLQSNKVAGGVRIKQIKNSDTPQGPAQTIKEYYYVSDYLNSRMNANISSGVLGGQAQYGFSNRLYFTHYENKKYVQLFSIFNPLFLLLENPFDNVGVDVVIQTSIFSSNSVLPACQNSNSHIGYTEVIEKYPDNSFTRYQFTNFDNGYLDEPFETTIIESKTPYNRYTSKAFERGKLLLQEEYNAEGSKVKSKTIEYEKDAVSDNYVRAIDAALYKAICPHSVLGYDEGTTYKIYTYLLRPSIITDTIFENNNTIVSTMVNRYNNQKLLSETSITNSDGKTHKTKYTYPSDVKEIINSPAIVGMVEKNILSDYVEKVLFVGDNIVGGEVREFYKFGDDNNPIYKPKHIKLLHSNIPIPENQLYTNIGGKSVLLSEHSAFQLEVSYKYDNRGKIIESIPTGNNIPTTYIWGYNFPIAKIVGATYEQVKDSLGEKNMSNLTMIDNLRNNTVLPNIQVFTYTYEPLFNVLTSSTDPRGVTTYYYHDYLGRLVEVYYYENNDLSKQRKVEEYDYHYRNP